MKFTSAGHGTIRITVKHPSYPEYCLELPRDYSTVVRFHADVQLERDPHHSTSTNAVVRVSS